VSVGLLLITHHRIGEELLRTAVVTFGGCPMQTRTLNVNADTDPDQLLDQARRHVRDLDQGVGVLVLTDCFGSTPSNIATRLLEEGGIRVVSGVSLPMLIRVMNYARLPLGDLSNKAVSGGFEGIVLLGPEKS
jgi:PTS system ascorbate-specific IIA component